MNKTIHETVQASIRLIVSRNPNYKLNIASVLTNTNVLCIRDQEHFTTVVQVIYKRDVVDFYGEPRVLHATEMVTFTHDDMVAYHCVSDHVARDAIHAVLYALCETLVKRIHALLEEHLAENTKQCDFEASKHKAKVDSLIEKLQRTRRGV